MIANLYLSLSKDKYKLSEIARALSSTERLDILKLLNTSTLSIKEIADELKIPLSTASSHASILHSCELIEIKEVFTKTGKSKLCSRNCDEILIDIFHPTENVSHSKKFSLPIGSFVDFQVTPNCGIATSSARIGHDDNDNSSFFDPDRHNAGLIWFNSGYLEYWLSNKMLPNTLEKLQISFEVCSEAPFYRNDWKSDIFVAINEKVIGEWTSLGDFGGRTGKQNPRWWPEELTQYGVLTTWEVNKFGTFVNNSKVSNLTIEELDIKGDNHFSIRIGVSKDARYRGGINLFGSTFGDYKQDIIVTVNW